MAFIARLPSFNINVTIHRLVTGTTHLADVTTTPAQLYTFKRNFQITWIDPQNTDRNVAGTWDFQESQYPVFFLMPKTATPRDPIKVILDIPAARHRDFLVYSNPNFAESLHYWIDQVEPRWAGFPNEHKIVVATRKMPV